jgi:hypothetical protein
MSDMNSQAKPGGSRSGSSMPKKEELTHEEFEHEKEKRELIDKHQHKDDIDYIYETD